MTNQIEFSSDLDLELSKLLDQVLHEQRSGFTQRLEHCRALLEAKPPGICKICSSIEETEDGEMNSNLNEERER